MGVPSDDDDTSKCQNMQHKLKYITMQLLFLERLKSENEC